MKSHLISITYMHDSGSLPPPYHSEYTIQLSSNGKGEILYLPDYPGEQTPQWLIEFAIEPEQWQAISLHLELAGVFSRKWRKAEQFTTGGSHDYLVVATENQHITIPPTLSEKDEELIQPVYKYIRDMVSLDIWTTISKQRESYEQSHSDA